MPKSTLFITIRPAIHLYINMDQVVLEVQKRDKSMKAKDLLANNLIPVEFYGRGVENQSFQVDYQTFRRVFRKAGSNTVIELKPDEGESVNALVHEVTYHPATDAFTHVDFMNVRMGEKLHTSIPLEFVGVSPAVKEENGILTTHLSEVNVECLPKDLIHSIEVDISSLVDFHSFIRVKDLNVPETVVILNEPEDVVINAVAPRVEEVAEAPAEGEEGEAAEGGDAAPAEGGDAAPAEGGE